MILLGKRRVFRLLTVMSLLLVLPFVANLQKASAAPIDHMGGGMHESCAAACAQLGGNSPQQAVLGGEEIRTPDPAPAEYEPYYLQFRKNYTPKKLYSYVYGSYSIRPPDIIRLTGNYRF